MKYAVSGRVYFLFILGHQEFRLGGFKNTDQVFFSFEKLMFSVCVYLCYFIRTIKGISAQVIGS